jgi:hypothetical protein
VFVLVPIAQRIAGVTVTASPSPWLVVVHLAVVGVSSRVAGLRTDPIEAAAISAAALGVGLTALVFFSDRSPPNHGPM